jgi:hypothetical protein
MSMLSALTPIHGSRAAPFSDVEKWSAGCVVIQGSDHLCKNRSHRRPPRPKCRRFLVLCSSATGPGIVLATGWALRNRVDFARLLSNAALIAGEGLFGGLATVDPAVRLVNSYRCSWPQHTFREPQPVA